METNNKNHTYKLLLALVLIDTIFLLLSGVNRYTPYLNDVKYLLTRDDSYAEKFQYIKEIFIAATMLIVASKYKLRGFLFFSGLFAYAFIDDAFQIHETVGGIIAAKLPFEHMYGLRAKDFGELAVTASVGIFFLIFGIIAYYRCTKQHKRQWINLLVFFAMIAVCGVGFDMLHSILDVDGISVGPVRLGSVVGALEDYGEMIFMSFCLWYSVVIYQAVKYSK